MTAYSGAYLWPPRPVSPISTSQLKVYQAKGYVAQVKKNGTNSIIKVNPDGTLQAWTRRGEAHRMWNFTERSAAKFKEIANGKFWVFNAELLHSKVHELKDINFIHDILVADGEFLLSTTLLERRKILEGLFLKGGEQETRSHIVIDDNTYLAKNYTENFEALFKSLTTKDDEGLVLKDPRAKLKMCIKADSNTWMVKCRRSELSPNYTI